MNYLSKKREFSGQISLCYCAWYGFGRAVIELLRTDSLMIGPIKVSFLLSLLIAVSAVVVLITFKLRKNQSQSNLSYVEVFSEDSKEAKEDEDE